MFKITVFACAMFAGQPIECVEMQTRETFESLPVCEEKLPAHAADIETRIKSLGFDPLININCVAQGNPT